MTTVTAQAMATAAAALILSFEPAQRTIACRSFPDDDERRQWFFTPTDHGGLPLSDMNSVQHRLVHQLVATGLSEAGYNTAAAIIGLDNILDRLENFTVDFGRPRGRDPLLYYVTFFGEPGDVAWAWRFGGHHLSLHYTIVHGAVVAATPSFFGADPADSPLLGPHLHRPLAAAEDIGRDLFRSLGGLADHALISPVAPTDIATGNRSKLSDGNQPVGLPDVFRGRFTGDTNALLERMQTDAEALLGLTEKHLEAISFSLQPKGLAVSQFNDVQLSTLRELLDAYLTRLPDDLADQQAELVATEMDALTFAWAGSAERYEPHYYRIQGRRLLIEYDNTQRGANHIHTVWRDLQSDFGGDVLARHYAESPH
ncbi:MAG: DUF3500 domain-containing protein [Hyphomicrobiaceae bacterium]